jgi:agmatine deiminase
MTAVIRKVFIITVTQSASGATEETRPVRGTQGRLRRIGRLALDLGVSPLAYYSLTALGIGTLHALLAATIVAGCWVLLTTVLGGRIDGLAFYILVMYGVMLALAAAVHDERLLLTRDPLTGGLAGLVFLGSCATSTPATAYLASKLYGGRPDTPQAHRAHIVETLVLGAGLVVEATVRMVLVFVLPVDVVARLRAGHRVRGAAAPGRLDVLESAPCHPTVIPSAQGADGMRTLDSTPAADGFAMPAEWEPHPHARAVLDGRVRVVETSAWPAWARDVAPTFVVDAEGRRRGVDFPFNGYGDQYPYWPTDDQYARKVLDSTRTERYRAPLVLEGGAFHVDGRGTCLVTAETLLDPARNPDPCRDRMTALLRDCLGVTQVIWLGQGLAYDTTRGHVDTLACFAAPGVVCLAWTDDERDPQYERGAAALEQLKGQTDAEGRPLRVEKLHVPGPLLVSDEEARGVDAVRPPARGRSPGGGSGDAGDGRGSARLPRPTATSTSPRTTCSPHCSTLPTTTRPCPYSPGCSPGTPWSDYRPGNCSSAAETSTARPSRSRPVRPDPRPPGHLPRTDGDPPPRPADHGLAGAEGARCGRRRTPGPPTGERRTVGGPVGCGQGGGSGSEYDRLTGQSPGAGVLMHGGQLGHRAVVGDVELEPAGVHLGDQLAELGSVAADPQARAAHPPSGVLGNRAGRAGGDPAVGDVVRQLRELLRGDAHMVHHDLERTAHGGRARGEVEGADDPIRAVAPKAVGVPRRVHRGHVRPRVDGELHHEAADRAPRPVDQDGLTGLQFGEIERRLPGREAGQRQRRGVDQLDRPGCRGQGLGRGEHVLGGAAGGVEGQHRHDPVADLQAGHVRAEFGDGARQVDPRHVRESDRDHFGQDTGADVVVDRVERRGRHPHQHLPGAGDRTVDVLVAQDLAAAELVETYCLHGTFLQGVVRASPTDEAISRAGGARRGVQISCTDRVELPITMRSMALTALPGSSAAPTASSSGTKWSAVGWATAAPGALLR